jgi:hypothetical protein
MRWRKVQVEFSRPGRKLRSVIEMCRHIHELHRGGNRLAAIQYDPSAKKWFWWTTKACAHGEQNSHRDRNKMYHSLRSAKAACIPFVRWGL